MFISYAINAEKFMNAIGSPQPEAVYNEANQSWYDDDDSRNKRMETALNKVPSI